MRSSPKHVYRVQSSHYVICEPRNLKPRRASSSFSRKFPPTKISRYTVCNTYPPSSHSLPTHSHILTLIPSPPHTVSSHPHPLPSSSPPLLTPSPPHPLTGCTIQSLYVWHNPGGRDGATECQVPRPHPPLGH